MTISQLIAVLIIGVLLFADCLLILVCLFEEDFDGTGDDNDSDDRI